MAPSTQRQDFRSVGTYGPTPRELFRAAQDSGALAMSAGSLVFTLFPIVSAWATLRPVPALVVTVICLVFGVLYLLACGVRLYRPRVRLAWLAALWACVLAMTPVLGLTVAFFVVYLCMACSILLPVRLGRVSVVALGVGAVVLGILTQQVFLGILGVVGLVFGIALGFVLQKAVLDERLEEAETRNAVLAVAAERERIARDLHDILGHSLTAVTVTAQLAQRLVDTDPAAAKDRVREIERISRQALADVRSTASGMRQVRVAGEVAAARSVLPAAGIEVEAPSALPDLGDDRAELFGYVVREGVTNVVRHSRAGRCTLEVTSCSVSVRDDGRGIPSGRRRSGLDGLAARVEAAAGTLDVTSSERGTCLTVRMPPVPSGESA